MKLQQLLFFPEQTKEKISIILEIILSCLQIKPKIVKDYATSLPQKEEKYSFLNYLCSKILANEDENFITTV